MNRSALPNSLLDPSGWARPEEFAAGTEKEDLLNQKESLAPNWISRPGVAASVIVPN
jgi:hypothetical protein